MFDVSFLDRKRYRSAGSVVTRSFQVNSFSTALPLPSYYFYYYYYFYHHHQYYYHLDPINWDADPVILPVDAALIQACHECRFIDAPSSLCLDIVTLFTTQFIFPQKTIENYYNTSLLVEVETLHLP
ncbi:hypothetical protein M0802_006609 [Mischocyttarus mexicanus]|nr:hypothetical protein M0802_006609 [Mischocyttarus mexicanus]